MPISGQGWELHIVRQAEQKRDTARRTVGSYEIFHDGHLTALSGTSVETKGPGDNSTENNGKRVEAGTYPLATQDGPHYVTIGYVVSHDCNEVPKPGMELRGTDARTEILVHPGHDFLASVGCINLTAPLPSGATDIDFEDSRDRVIAAINDLKAYLGSKFPHHNGEPIPGAHVVIDGLP